MKKIYLILAVFALLSMSLNAQTKATITVASSDFSDANWWTILSDNIGNTWSVTGGQGVYSYSFSYAADDWLVSSPIALQAGMTYKFYIDAWAGLTSYPERLEIWLADANTVNALSSGTSVIGSTNVNWGSSSSSKTLSNENLTVSTSGNYYIGIHATSDKNMYNLYVDNMIITTENTNPLIMASPSSVSMSAAPGGNATETITVTGDNLTGSINASISGDAAFSVNPSSLGTSGGSLTVTYSPTAPGNHSATLTLTSAGAQDVVINLDGSCVAGTTYELVTDPSTQLVDGKEYILVGRTEYAMGAISNNYGSAVAITDNGDGTVTVPGTASPLVFTLHSYSSNYTSGYALEANGNYLRPSSSNGTGLTTATTSNDNTCWSPVADSKSTGGYGIEYSYLSTSRAVSFRESSTVSARFAYYAKSNLTAASTEYYYALLYKKVENVEPVHDLAITLSEPTAVIAGETATVTATVTNNGNQTETGYTVTFSDGTNTFSTQTGGELAPGATATFTATYPTTTAGTVTITANVACTDDANATNNDATATLTVNLPKTATPTINVVTNADGSKTITAVGDGTVHLYVNGTEVTNPYTIMPSADGDQTYTVTATAQEEGKQISDTATETVTVPEAGRSPQPTITFTDNGDGSYTITVTGTGEVAVYIEDAEHAGAPIATADGSFSFNVEQHSQAMSITVTATNQEEGLAVSRPVTETYPIPAMTIDGTFQTLDPQPANASTPIDLSKVMFVDRFRKVIPFENNHPRLYDYYLQETQVRQRTSNSVEVPVKHTGSDGLGFYSLNQIDNDTVRTLVMDVRNAAMEMELESDPGIYFYYGSRSTVAYPDQADRKYLGVLQHTTDDYYTETLNPSYDYQQSYPGGTPHIHLDTDTILGEYNDYLMYVPQVMTMGFDRVLYETDHIHNSYGAPKWKTGVGDVTLNSVDVELQDSPSATWNDGKDINMYIMTLDATGYMPTVNTMPYEPYMFRVFVESKNGKLRNWRWVPDDTVNHVGSHFEAAPGTTTGPICVWSEYVKDSVNVTFNGNEIYFVKEKVDRDSLNMPWTIPGEMNILFAAEANMETTGEGDAERIIEDDLKIYVRFYYIVKGSADGHTPVVHGQRPRDGEGDAPAGYGSESPGTPPSPSTGVKEVQYYGDVVSTTYYNVQGMTSDKPFDGINIVVVRYSNGTTRAFKVVR